MKRFFLLLIFPFLGKSQFAPAAGQPGSTAIKKDSSIIVNWAVHCHIVRGLQDISNPAGAYASYGDSSSAVGPADGANVVSLGDGGSATLTFQSPITNGPGYDFCVFENAFDPGFLELGFVEVSSDGINYTRFPATCNVQNTVQIGPFDTSSDPTKIYNLAGKYIVNYGAPFDLQELAGTPGLDITGVTHVRVIDVVGCIQPQYARYDKNSNIINDLWPTAFPSSGFDLDAVGVMHQRPVGIKENSDLKDELLVYPAVTKDEIFISCNRSNVKLEVKDVSGKIVAAKNDVQNLHALSLKDLEAGIYFVTVKSGDAAVTKKIIRQN
jgi:hypothetical protein